MSRHPQHFLKSPEAADFDEDTLVTMSEQDAYDLIVRTRWPDGVPVCPHCSFRGAWKVTRTVRLKNGSMVTRNLFKCKRNEEGNRCRKHFSATSGTMALHSHKKPLKTYLKGVYNFSHAPKGMAALRMRFRLRTSYKSAFHLTHRLRAALLAETSAGPPLRGSIEADLQFFGGYMRPTRLNAERQDRRLKRRDDERSSGVLVMRERGADGRSRVALARNEVDATPIVIKNCEENSRLYIDKAPGWGPKLQLHFERVFQINHKRSYAMYEDGHRVNTNQAESLNSRARRAEIGVYHRIAPEARREEDKRRRRNYLASYAGEMAWRETNRRKTALELYHGVLAAALRQPRDSSWRGYYAERDPETQAQVA